MRTSWFLNVAVLLATAVSAPAITITFNGNLNQDDDTVLFQYTVQNTGLVTVATTSFASGGFSPILTVFDQFGVFVFENIGYSNPVISDASLSWNSLAGVLYNVVLSQYDNQSIAGQNGFGNRSDGFLRQGEGNFTGQPPFNIGGGSFLLPGGEQRSSDWSIEFSSADPTLEATEIPEPSTAALGGIGAAVVYALARARRRKKQLGQDN